MNKYCKSCKQTLPIAEFPQYILRGKQYSRFMCRPCFNAHRRQRHANKPAVRLRAQGGKCALCERPGQIPDYDPQGSLRGVLCGYCAKQVASIVLDPALLRSITRRFTDPDLQRLGLYLLGERVTSGKD